MAADIAIPEISIAQCRKQSMADCRVFPGQNSRFHIVIGIAPLWGFGTFNSASQSQAQNNPTGNPGLCYNNTWPFVYKTLTETWVFTTPQTGVPSPQTLTVVSQWTDYFDTGLQTSFTGTVPISIVSSLAVTSPTTITGSSSFTGGTPSYTQTLSYTATLSNPVTPSANWAALTSTAAGMLNEISLPPISPSTGGAGPNGGQNLLQMVYPISISPGYAVVNSATLGDYNVICAAANGLGCQLGAQCTLLGGMPQNNWVPQNPPVPVILQYCFEKSIDDNLNFTSVNCNVGAVVCVSSRWLLNGQGSGGISGLTPAETNHQQINGQKMDFSGTGGLPNLLSVITPSGFQTANQISASGTLYADPLAFWPQTLTFQPSDVGVNLWGTSAAQYGILGFRTTPI
jgi:hypothetical protein